MDDRVANSGGPWDAAARMRTTCWTQVRLAAGGEDPAAGEALEELCRRYWYPLYAFLRRSGEKPDDAQDLVQGFFVRLLDPTRNRLASAQPERGRFRSFLLASLKHYAADRRQHAAAAIRNPGQPLLSIDTQDAEGRYLTEPAHLDDPARLFDRRWALTAIERALRRVREEYARAGQTERFELLQGALRGEKLDFSQAEIGRRLGISENAVAKAVHDLKKKFQASLKREVRDTVDSEADLKEELRDLLAAIYG